MNKTADFLTGTKVIEEVESPVNGKLTVMKDLFWGIYIKGGGLTQTGGVMYSVWKSTLKQISKQKKTISDCLVLGLGGGDAAGLVSDYWPDAKIIGVDIDPVIVDLGRKYLGLDQTATGVVIKIEDGYEFAQRQAAGNKRYDLVCVDIYVGDKVPGKFETDKFINYIKKLLTEDGIAVFNRLYYDQKKDLAHKFEKKLEKVFAKVDRVYPEANMVFVCTD